MGLTLWWQSVTVMQNIKLYFHHFRSWNNLLMIKNLNYRTLFFFRPLVSDNYFILTLLLPGYSQNNPRICHRSETIGHLCDDQRLSVLHASPQGEAPGCLAAEQHLHQLALRPCCSSPPPHPSSWNSQVVSEVHDPSCSAASINITSLWKCF